MRKSSLARALGIGPDSVAAYERGRRLPKLPLFFRMTFPLDLCLGDLEVVVTEAIAGGEVGVLKEAVAKALGPALQGQRERRGLTSLGVAERTGLSVDQLSRIESGRVCPSLLHFLRLAGILVIHLGDVEILAIKVALVDEEPLAGTREVGIPAEVMS